MHLQFHPINVDDVAGMDAAVYFEKH